MSEVNSFIGTKQMLEIGSLLNIQAKNALKWQIELQNSIGIKPLQLNNNTNPNYWVYGTLSENRKEKIAYFKSKGYNATGVHINNNIYSILNNKIELKGVNEFMNHFVALPCGWWVDKSHIAI